ncbi:cupin domain-containing protein [Caenimonas aquaedulcis]|uniref:Cupin domain-containing protein n=1 Tax=Caenimonas aquaedulcis TaxID=2793270 RepID=A0A931H8V8_9BURK|nr:cupin domain-containing protein [Caenimonas aquaedulcis]MBG9390537.1 cupin domain-containing protein [Caenimonas aquaedulcis]
MKDDQALLARVKARVMKAIREQATSRPANPQVVRLGDAAGWETVAAGIERKMFWSADEVRSCLVRVAPGTTVPGHLHEVDEECLVLAGSCRIGPDIELRTGDFHVGRRGTWHGDAYTETGATLYLRGSPVL